MRKVLLFKYSYAFVVLPGGLGTLDELTEALTLIQTGKILQFPVVLMGVEYWRLFNGLLKEMVAHGTMSATDLDLFLATDSVTDAMAHIEHHADSTLRPRAAEGTAAAALAVGRCAERNDQARLGKPGPTTARLDLDADRAAHAGAAVAAIAVGILGQVLLVIRFGVVERRRRRELRCDCAVTGAASRS